MRNNPGILLRSVLCSHKGSFTDCCGASSAHRKKHKFFFVMVTFLLQLIGGGIKHAECAGLDVDLKKEPPKSNEIDEAGPSMSTPVDNLPDPAPIEKGKIKQECLGQISRCWQKEIRREKQRLNPSKGSLDSVISAFIIRRWEGASLEQIRAQRNELILDKGRSDFYMEFREFIEILNG